MNHKVAIVNTTYNSGGAAKAALSLMEAFNDKNIAADARLFHCGTSVRTDELVGFKRTGAKHTNALLSRFNGAMSVFDFGVAERVLSETKRDDILNIHNLHGYYIDYQKLITGWGDRPIVWTWHDMWGATGRCGFSFDCDLWHSGCASCPKKMIYPAAWIDRASREFQYKFELFSALPRLRIVTPSTWLSNIAIKRGYASEIVSTIPYPVRTDIFRFKSREKARKDLDLIAKKNKIILFVAADCNDERKGYADFVETVQKLGCCGIAIGRKPRKPSSDVMHIGSITDAKLLSAYYSAADIMLIPSYADNYPNTVLEALCCGTPVVGYSVGGLGALLSNEGCIAVDVGDVNQLVDSVYELFNARVERFDSKTISCTAREKWAPSSIATEYLNLFEKIF